MSKNSMGDIVFTNLIWRFAERSGAQFVTFFVSIILARLLSPEIYGTVALITVFTTILQVLVDSGLGNALIQKKNADNIDFSTVFFANIVFCILLYIVLFICSPLIAQFYNMPELTPIVRVMGISILISGVKNVQQAYVSRNMLFKKFFFSTLAGTMGAAVIGIAMAYMGFGVWALVAQNLFNLTVDTIVLWVTVKWRPQCCFSFARFKELFSYGWKLLISALINTIYLDIRQLLIGKMYSAEDLAFYNRGKQLPNQLASNINNSIDSVLFSAMSASQSDKTTVKKMTRTAIRVSSYVMWPVMMGLAAISTPLIRLLLTEKWMSCVPYLVIFCISCAFQPINTANINAIKAMGRSDLYLKLEIIKKIFGLILLLAVLKFGVLVICLSVLFYNIVAQIINSFPNRKLLGYTYIAQIKDIVPFIVLSTVMAVLVYFIGFLPLPDIILLCIQGIFGVVIYTGLSIILKLDTLDFILKRVKNTMKMRTK